jgi:hypothetical protein
MEPRHDSLVVFGHTVKRDHSEIWSYGLEVDANTTVPPAPAAGLPPGQTYCAERATV